MELDCVKPVTFRLGWDRLLVNPIAIGSPITVITIGIPEVDAADALATSSDAPISTFGLVDTSSCRAWPLDARNGITESRQARIIASAHS